LHQNKKLNTNRKQKRNVSETLFDPRKERMRTKKSNEISFTSKIRKYIFLKVTIQVFPHNKTGHNRFCKKEA